MYRRFFSGSPASYFLFGPRGTGKSTWVREHHPQAIWFDLLDPAERRRLVAHPELLREQLLAREGTLDVIIDEVQRVPDLLTVVHQLIEQRPSTRFILTGSSARKLKQAGVDLLAGRALVFSMHPLMAAEMGSHFVLEKALLYGLLPLVVQSVDPARTLSAYTATYLEEEVIAEGIVRNMGNFARFLEAISFSHASQLNISNVARECQVERKVVEGYVQILEDLLLSFRLPVFTKRAQRQVSVHPKFYLFDCGVYRSLRPQGPLDRVEEIDGLALEGLVVQHLRGWIAYSKEPIQLYFWRTRQGVEVDFVLYGPNTFCAIEVKNSANVSRHDLRSLRTFCTDYPECRGYLLYRGKQRLLIDGILCFPVQEFLAALRPNGPIVSSDL